MKIVLCVPYESHLKAKPVLVGYCKHAHLVTEPYKPHEECDMEYCLEDKQFHYFTKRRMWPCRICSHYYPTYNGLLNHECEWE